MDVLQNSLPLSIRRTLEKLPKPLNETYDRIPSEIKKPSGDHAHRLLKCLVVAIQPLRVEELMELLAYNFDEAAGGIPKVNSNWRWEDREQAVLSTCSSFTNSLRLETTEVKSGKDTIIESLKHCTVTKSLLNS